MHIQCAMGYSMRIYWSLALAANLALARLVVQRHSLPNMVTSGPPKKQDATAKIQTPVGDVMDATSIFYIYIFKSK